MAERWDAERSLMAHFAAAENGEPLNISDADLRAHLQRIIAEMLATKGWNQNQRVEARKIEEALPSRGRWPAALMECC